MSQEHPSYANLANLKMLESLYEEWIEDKTRVDPSWQNFFDGMQLAAALPRVLPQRQDSADLRVHYLIDAYRTYGHLLAKCDVIATQPPSFPEELKIENFGLIEKDLNEVFPTCGFIDKEKAPLREIIDILQKTYCQTIGIEYKNLVPVSIENWIQKRIEPFFPTQLNAEEEIEILKQLNQAEGFETFLHTKYVGQKRFSLEGAETFIPIVHAILQKGGQLGVTEVVVGMAHRGRLNVLANIMGKSYSYIFEEFEDYFTPDLGESTGDVKYHMGLKGTYSTREKKELKIVLCANPSHLESVNCVVEGSARALQEEKKDSSAKKEVLPILVHGDASMAGQGVVYEILTMGKLNGYNTRGTIHIVINNQIGFTTLSKDGRSTRYCTDIAKAFGAPILHVNGEDPAKCVAAAHLAIELRQEFECDVFIDLMGYRKYGHNEGDEPTFTQPLEYQIIRAKKTIREIYRDHLIETNILSKTQAEEMEKAFHNDLSKILESVKSKKTAPNTFEIPQKDKISEALLFPFETKVDLSLLQELGKKLVQFPSNMNLHPKVLRLLKERQKMLEQDPASSMIDWGMGELLAYATLCVQGIHVRISGQDCRRGTFSHRHGIYVDQVNAEHYFPISHLSDKQAAFDLFNSPLSEFGVMGFEFGYSLEYPNSLVLWEGQYGDFANGAQIIIDQYIASSEMKWGLPTNLTLLLPHGYEGSGPEHSSGRMERFLQLCADENMIIANCTTPAQLFHLLRWQAFRKEKKPLILFTPKVLLRFPLCRSSLSDFSEKKFEPILDDPSGITNPERIFLCTGKMYYELIQQREERKTQDVIIRIEQIYPLNTIRLKELFEKYSGAKECIWVQEEHRNMGAWGFLKNRLELLLEGKKPLFYVGRREAASPAAGSHALHELERQNLFKQLYSQGSSS